MVLRRLKYSRKIQVLFIPVFVLMAFGLLIVYRMAAGSLEDEHQERLRRTAHLTEERLQATAKEMMKIVNLFQTNRTVKEYLYLSTVLGGDRGPLKDMLRPLQESLDIDDLDLYDRHGVRVIDLDRLNECAHERITGIAGTLPRKAMYGFMQNARTLKIAAVSPLTDTNGTVGYIAVGKYIDSRYREELKAISGNELYWIDKDNRIISEADHASMPYSPDDGKLTVNGITHSLVERKISSVSGEPLGMLVIALSNKGLNASVTRLKLSMFAMLGLAALLSFVMSGLFIKTLVEPLDNITKFTGKVARGELDDELAVSGDDELTALAEHFNDMQKKLKTQRDVVRQYTDNLERAVQERTAELKKVELQLLQSQKMEAVGQLAGGIAHDFNNFLTAIIGFAGMFQKKLRADDPLRPYADRIISVSQRASSLTRSLLTFSRKQIVNPVPVDLNEIVKHAEKILLRLIGEDIELTLSLPDASFIISADSGQLEQVLLNLATNARDAMPAGGCLSIETRSVQLDAAFVEKNGWGRPGTYAVLTVTDTGAGMDEAIREKVFEPFFTTKEAGKGTGLGLSMVYGIIKQHEGFINIYSEVGAGTSIKIYLPLVPGAAVDLREEHAVPPLGGTETILLAEDNELVRELARTSLAEAGYTVIVAEQGEDAVNAFMAEKDRIDLLVLDVIMPKKNGKIVYEEIKKVRPDIKALFVSGYTADILYTRGILDQGINLIQKPFLMNELLHKVRSVLDS